MRTRSKSEFLTLGNGFYEGIKGKHMFLWGFYEKRKMENDVSWKKGRGKKGNAAVFDLDFCRISEVFEV